LPRLLQAAGWSLHPVGFYFKVVRPARFLRNIRPLRKTPLRRALLDLAAASGAGWLGTRALRLRALSAPPPAAIEAASSFGPWADELWDECRSQYGAIGVRNSEVLNRLYPAGEPRFLRLKAVQPGRVVGWAVLLDTVMRDDAYFGNMRLGSIVDGLAQPEDAGAIVAAATRELEKRAVDLIVSNQCHGAWSRSLRQCGFLQGPSNFIFAASKKLAALIPRFDELHINRGDGDGPIHL
jgi:hypothetical protein